MVKGKMKKGNKTTTLEINGVSAEDLLCYYDNVRILIGHTIKTLEDGGNEALREWDKAIAKGIDYNIIIHIDKET